MEGVIGILVITVLLGRVPVISAPNCELRSFGKQQEGMVGKDGHFPWLGVLKVQIDDEIPRTAMTGLVLVKRQHAIGIARDLAQIPKDLFRQNSMAIFKHGKGRWRRRPSHCIFPPDHDTAFISIALVKLQLRKGEIVPFKPVCLHLKPFNMSQELYMIGYNDENKSLKKVIHQVKYVRTSLCRLFYNETETFINGVVHQTQPPVDFLCALGANFTEDCVWDNGMALVSNSTGPWTLLGLSTVGPGCAAPARFLSLNPHLPWLQNVLRRTPQYRRTDVISYRAEGVTADPEAETTTEQVIPLYRFFGKHDIYLDEIPYKVYRIDKDAVLIQHFDYKYERKTKDCDNKRLKLAYRERFRILDQYRHEGTIQYRISLYDMAMKGFRCVKLEVRGRKRSPATLWYKYAFDNEVFNLSKYPETPDELLNYYPLVTIAPDMTKPPNFAYGEKQQYRPGPHLRPQAVEPPPSLKVYHLNILLWVTFSKKAFLHLQVYGEKKSFFTTPHPPTSPTTVSTRSTKWTTSYPTPAWELHLTTSSTTTRPYVHYHTPAKRTHPTRRTPGPPPFFRMGRNGTKKNKLPNFLGRFRVKIPIETTPALDHIERTRLEEYLGHFRVTGSPATSATLGHLKAITQRDTDRFRVRVPPATNPILDKTEETTIQPYHGVIGPLATNPTQDNTLDNVGLKIPLRANTIQDNTQKITLSRYPGQVRATLPPAIHPTLNHTGKITLQQYPGHVRITIPPATKPTLDQPEEAILEGYPDYIRATVPPATNPTLDHSETTLQRYPDHVKFTAPPATNATVDHIKEITQQRYPGRFRVKIPPATKPTLNHTEGPKQQRYPGLQRIMLHTDPLILKNKTNQNMSTQGEKKYKTWPWPRLTRPYPSRYRTTTIITTTTRPVTTKPIKSSWVTIRPQNSRTKWHRKYAVGRPYQPRRTTPRYLYSYKTKPNYPYGNRWSERRQKALIRKTERLAMAARNRAAEDNLL